MMDTKFFKCEHCCNIIGVIHDAGVPIMCCGQKMTQLIPGAVEAGVEKHLPVVTVSENRVKVEVGAAPHPMTQEHSILWIYLRTDKGGQRKNLQADEKPEASFALLDEKATAAYAYCNLHGLWKTEI